MTEGRIASRADAFKAVSGATTEMPMREKQLVASMRQGRQVMWQILDEDPVYGYLAGMDDDTYLVLQPWEDMNQRSGFHKKLIPKQNLLFMDILDEQTFRDEEHHKEMEQIVKPFRDSINNKYPPR